MLDLREKAITSILEVAYVNLDQILKGPLCKQTPPSEVDCRCMILGSYTSFLIAQGLYPQCKKAMEVTMSLQELIAMFAKLNLRTYESHDYKAIYNRTSQIMDVASYMRPSSIDKNKLIGQGLTEHKMCGEIVNIFARSTKICASVPSPVLPQHQNHMWTQAKKLA